ncbi:MAG TPA: dihydrolipoamide acetyltransferase family protein [Solirubrobacterales bacterium]|nr:dihydrolipoamide acetyltransferase family protein [Solirubrobacterales bacterium]
MSQALAERTIAMPRLSDAMEEAVILVWLKGAGEAIAKGEPLVEIETDKATMVYEAEVDGVLGELLAAAGESVALGAPIATVMVAGEEPAPARSPSAPQKQRVRATPVARRVAADLGVELAALHGSGPAGRIVRRDVLAAAPASTAPTVTASPVPTPADGERVELSATQRTIARRMVESRREIPDFTVSAEVNVTAALALRRELNEALPEARISVNDLVVRAAAIALREQPALNSSWGGDHVVRHAGVHVGVAVAAGDDALLVPTIFDADRKSLPEIAAATRAAGERARDRASTPEELGGATFTVSNLGMFGVSGFEAVINPPQAAILAVGGSARRPVFAADGSVAAVELMQLSLCSDHRLVYGAAAARFLARLRELLERPLLLTMPPCGGPTPGRADG